MLLVMVEAGRAVLLRRVGLAAGTLREGIPCGRWILTLTTLARLAVTQVLGYLARISLRGGDEPERFVVVALHERVSGT
jgi:hypothetical protein